MCLRAQEIIFFYFFAKPKKKMFTLSTVMKIFLHVHGV